MKTIDRNDARVRFARGEKFVSVWTGNKSGKQVFITAGDTESIALASASMELGKLYEKTGKDWGRKGTIEAYRII